MMIELASHKKAVIILAFHLFSLTHMSANAPLATAATALLAPKRRPFRPYFRKMHPKGPDGLDPEFLIARECFRPANLASQASLAFANLVCISSSPCDNCCSPKRLMTLLQSQLKPYQDSERRIYLFIHSTRNDNMSSQSCEL
jgi:hypothetical protein